MLVQNRYHPYAPPGKRMIREQPRKFDPMPYGQLLTRLLELQLVELKEIPPTLSWILEGCKRKFCEYHPGASIHSIEDCMEFKCKVQDLIDYKAISFTQTVRV